ncbi:hypothetical protein D6779_00840 [Candidatus Parcubacteria bacterium]|nr:MAG: hypothetical protein D6779_00840 [Candidatus Parcubacteria bacterium]
MSVKVSRRLVLAAAVAGAASLTGCVSTGGKNLMDSLGNTEYKNQNPYNPIKVVDAQIKAPVSLKDLGVERFESVFVTPEAAGSVDANPMLYINGVPIRGNTGNGVAQTFIKAPYGYLVAVKQAGGTCKGQPLPSDKVSLVFYKVSKQGDLMGEVACVPNRNAVEFMATDRAIFYPAEISRNPSTNSMVKSWVGITPEGNKIIGPRMVKQALPLDDHRWSVNDGKKLWLYDEKTGQRKEMGWDTSRRFVTPPAVFINTVPYPSSYKTHAFAAEWYQYLPNAITRDYRGGAWGAQILDQEHPYKCYGRIGRACSWMLWRPVNTTAVGRVPKFPVYSAFVWGNGKKDAYIAAFDGDQKLLATTKSPYMIYELMGDKAYKLPMWSSRVNLSGQDLRPRIIITPKAVVVINGNDDDYKNKGKGYAILKPSEIHSVSKEELNKIWAQYPSLEP